MSERWAPDSWRSKPVLQVPDYPDLKARAFTCLAQVIGPGDEQSSLFVEAREVWEQKGNVAALARPPVGSAHPA